MSTNTFGKGLVGFVQCAAIGWISVGGVSVGSAVRSGTISTGEWRPMGKGRPAMTSDLALGIVLGLLVSYPLATLVVSRIRPRYPWWMWLRWPWSMAKIRRADMAIAWLEWDIGMRHDPPPWKRDRRVDELWEEADDDK